MKRVACILGAVAALLAGTAAESFNATAVHNVNVSYVDGQFTPNNTLANPGDIVQFHFYPTNHSVIQAAPGNACVPIEDVVYGAPGFFSGHQIITDPSKTPPTWNLTINDTNPIYYFCSAVGSCQAGMIGGINLPNASALDTQLQAALHAPFMIDNRQIPALDSNSSSGAPSSGSGHSGLSGGAIAGIVIAIVAIVVLLGAVLWLLGRHKGLISAGVVSKNSGGGSYSRAARTEQWADSSAVGAAAGATTSAPSEHTWAGAPGHDMSMNYASQRVSGQGAPMGWPYSPHHAPQAGHFPGQSYGGEHAGYFDPGSPAPGAGWQSPSELMSPKVTNVQEIMELGNTQVSELEASHPAKE